MISTTTAIISTHGRSARRRSVCKSREDIVPRRFCACRPARTSYAHEKRRGTPGILHQSDVSRRRRASADDDERPLSNAQHPSVIPRCASPTTPGGLTTLCLETDIAVASGTLDFRILCAQDSPGDTTDTVSLFGVQGGGGDADYSTTGPGVDDLTFRRLVARPWGVIARTRLDRAGCQQAPTVRSLSSTTRSCTSNPRLDKILFRSSLRRPATSPKAVHTLNPDALAFDTERLHAGVRKMLDPRAITLCFPDILRPTSSPAPAHHRIRRGESEFSSCFYRRARLIAF